LLSEVSDGIDSIAFPIISIFTPDQFQQLITG